MILSQAQAQAVYAAMCALNNISANPGIEISFVGLTPDDEDSPMARFDVMELASGQIYICTGPSFQLERKEFHESQAAFAEAYGLN